MARATNGIITRKVSCEEILTVVEQKYKKVKEDPKATEDYAVLYFTAGGYERDLRITMNAKLYDDEKSGKEYGVKLPDEVTFLSMTFEDDSPDIMRNIVSAFGGYVRDSDWIGKSEEYYEVEARL